MENHAFHMKREKQGSKWVGKLTPECQYEELFNGEIVHCKCKEAAFE